MKKLSFICCCLLMLSCSNKTPLQLPGVEALPVIKLDNAASIYLFYDEHEPDSLRMDKKQDAKTATERVFYIDKRLLLRQLVLQLKNEMKKTADSVAVKRYFSVTNTDKTLSFLDFSGVTYSANNEFSKFYIKDHPEKHMALLTLSLNFKMNDEVTVDGNPIERSELTAFLKNYIDFVSEGKQTLIYLNFDENLTFGDYISNYDLIMKINAPAVKIAETQFIYNEALLPDCNCVL